MEKLKYFLECYFNMSMCYRDLDELITKFKTKEAKPHQREFIQELENIIAGEKYSETVRYIDKYGDRIMSLNKTKIFIKFLHDRFKDIPNPMRPVDFYDIK